VDDNIRPDTTVLGGERRLLLEVAVRDHPRHLDHAPQLHLTPATPRLRVSKRRHEVAGLVAKQFLALVQRPDLLAEARVRLSPADLELLQARTDLAQGLRDRLHHVLDRLLTLLEV